MPFLIGNELALFTVPSTQQKLGMDINTVEILFHEALAGYFTLYLQLFIIPCILRGMMAALLPTKQVQGYLFHPTSSLGFLEIRVCRPEKYSHSRSDREQIDQGLIFSNDETASP